MTGETGTSLERRLRDVEMKTIVSILIFTMLTLGAFALLGYSTCNHPIQETAETNQTANTEKENCATFHSALIVGFNATGLYIHRFREEIVAVGTMFIAAFTVILGFATAALYLATRDLVRGAELTAKRQLRAYVVVHVRDFDWPRSEDGAVLITLELKNTGQTPAHDLRSITRTNIFDYPFRPEFDFSLKTGEGPSVGLIGPGQCTGIESMSDALTKDDWIILKWDKTKRLCTYGTVTYRDVFDDPQWTHFCISHFIEIDESTGRITTTGRTAERHNEAS
jgi:hypothetical protein